VHLHDYTRVTTEGRVEVSGTIRATVIHDEKLKIAGIVNLEHLLDGCC